MVAFLPDEPPALADLDPSDPGATDAAPDLVDVDGRLLPRRRRHWPHQLLEVQVLVQLEPLAGQDEQRRLADVQDRVADSLQELGHEQVRDEEGGILVGLPQAAEGLGQRLAILAVQVGLAPAGGLWFFYAGPGGRGGYL